MFAMINPHLLKYAFPEKLLALPLKNVIKKHLGV
jgi:hypothetical protein